MTELGNGLYNAIHHEAALPVREAELAMRRRLGDSEEELLVVQGNLAGTYQALGRHEDALRMRQNVYSRRLKLNGEERCTVTAAICYASTLKDLNRFEEIKSLMRKIMPVARRVVGESHELTLRVKWNNARALYEDPSATLDDLREALTTLEEVERTARRVLGGAHPLTEWIEYDLRNVRAALRARETPSLPEDV